jgi:hypothetical protein
MAKVLTEQPRLWGAAAEDPRQVGDGAPLHSAEAFDLARALNNRMTYGEPSFQFLHDISMPAAGDTTSLRRIRWRQKSVLGDGTCMLGQAPIYVPIDATRLRWSLGIYRDPADGFDPVPVNLNVNTITIYLCSEPVRELTDPSPGIITFDNENCRTFSPIFLAGAWTSNAVAAGATANGSGESMYTRIRSNTWTNFAPRGVNNINDRTGDPWAYVIVTADFTAGQPNESIRGAELSIWFEYDDAPFLMDDAARGPARNGKPALAQVYRRIVETANKFAMRPRPIQNWWGGNPSNTTETIAQSSIRRMWLTGEMGAPRIKAQVLALPVADVLGAPKTGLQVFAGDHDQSGWKVVPQSPGRKEDINTATTDWYPAYAAPLSLFGDFHQADYTSPATAREIRIQVGDSISASPGPQVRSGLVVERKITNPVVGIEAIPLDPYTMGAEILGAGPTYRDLRALRDFINRLSRQKMIHFGWGIEKNSATGTYGHVLNGTQWRYILNTAIGEGGIAPTVDGPGIEIPTRYTGVGMGGLGSTVRAYVRIFAAMSGGANTARIGYYQRNNSGGMTPAAAPVFNTPVISGTTPQWYPNTTTIDEAADPYMYLNTNPAYDTNNVVLCAACNGSTDNLLVYAWTICVRASEAV